MLTRNATLKETTLHVVTVDGMLLFTRKWAGKKNQPTAFIGHTQPTHSGHYKDLCRALNSAGMTVYAGDLRGHGQSVNKSQPLVHIAKDQGWACLIRDMETHLDEAFDGVRFEDRVIIVQNISALLVLEVLKKRPRLAQKIVLTCPAIQPVTATLARAFVRAKMRIKSVDVPDEHTLHHVYSFLSARIGNCRSPADVLSADQDLVDEILADDRGFATPTLGYWSAIFEGNDVAWNWPEQTQIDPDTRFLLLNGAQDPLMGQGRLIKPVEDWLRAAGATHVDTHLVEGGRTAILLDQRSLDIASILTHWCGGSAAMPAKIQQDTNTLEIARHVLKSLGVDEAALTGAEPSDLIEKCYDAIEQEDRWIEVLYQLSLRSDTDPHALDALLADVMPHWDRSFSLNRKMADASAMRVVLETVIDRLDIGTGVLQGSHRLIYQNASFARLIAESLDEPVPTDDPGLTEDLLQDLLSPEFCKAVRAGAKEYVLVHDGHPIGFYFRPAALQKMQTQGHDELGLLVLRLHENGNDVAEDSRLSMVELAYGLTRQEAQIALSIVAGKAPTEIAHAMGISINTVRTHLKRGYEKMDVKGQTEMASRLLNGPLGWLTR